jgi:hypothetical protein
MIALRKYLIGTSVRRVKFWRAWPEWVMNGTPSAKQPRAAIMTLA